MQMFQDSGPRTVSCGTPESTVRGNDTAKNKGYVIHCWSSNYETDILKAVYRGDGSEVQGDALTVPCFHGLI
jgi:hypothetical protein